ncbi:MAG: hypothetical protein B6D63_04030 [Candidatus Latescibacteria bacterium 4484_7]|nr:MAG: hypothetical protein B6D63_04030 [Candidatus Latescibacteria bacterium 4484_7]
MPSNEKTNPLGTVTRLFLSSKESKEKRRGENAEAVIWLAVSDGGMNRAYLTAGFAEAFSDHRLNVTLLELCSGLPNIGYYFALEPVQYLLSVVEKEHVVAGRWSERLGYLSARSTNVMIGYRNRMLPLNYPHMLFLSFTFPSSVPGHHSLFDVRRVTQAYTGLENEGAGIPDAVVAVGEGNDERTVEFIENVREIFPDTLLLQIATVEESGLESNEKGTIDAEGWAIPRSVCYGSSRRVPPGDLLFSELAGNILQLLSFRRKKSMKGSDVKGA